MENLVLIDRMRSMSDHVLLIGWLVIF